MKTESIPSTLSKIYHLDFYILALGTGPDLKKLLPSKPYVHQGAECHRRQSGGEERTVYVGRMDYDCPCGSQSATFLQCSYSQGVHMSKGTQYISALT